MSDLKEPVRLRKWGVDLSEELVLRGKQISELQVEFDRINELLGQHIRFVQLFKRTAPTQYDLVMKEFVNQNNKDTKKYDSQF